MTLAPPKLEPRLKAIAHEIQTSAHTDVGSDHALLPRFLLDTGRATFVIAIEKTQLPFLNSKQTLRSYIKQGKADVRLGDGLSVLAQEEVESLSISGLGAERIIKILERFPERVPDRLILQANDKPERLRAWALKTGFHLLNEQMTDGFWHYVVLTFKRSRLKDPAYKKVPEDLAIYAGPLLLKERHPLLLKELRKNELYLKTQLGKHNSQELQKKLKLTQEALAYYA